MFDIHTHILYGVDDGADSKDVSIYLLDQAKENGINKILLTPHQNEELIRTEELIQKYNIFKEEFKDYNIDFYLGSEIYYYPNMLDDLDNNKLLRLNNTKYILIEFSTTMETDIKNIIYDLKLRGYKPIIAHIERYNYLTVDDYKEIKAQGALIQVNTKSFLNKSYKKQLKYLLKNKLIDFISSDCHNKHRDIDFSYVKKLISKKYKDQYNKLFNEIPEFIDDNNDSKGNINRGVHPKNGLIYRFIKRCFDVVASFSFLLLFGWIILLLMFIKFCEDGHNPIYTSIRVGKNGKLIKFHKIRTMKPNAEQLKAQLIAEGKNEADGPVFKMKNDPRITKVGKVYRKLSLDELPQIWDIFVGRISVVGPRSPIYEDSNTRITESNYRKMAYCSQ